MNKELFELGVAIGFFGFGLVIGASGWIVQWLKNKKKVVSEKEVEKEIKKHSQVHDLLGDLRFKTDAGRACLFEFHNGEYYISGQPILKFSMTNESLVLGVSPTKDRNQSHLISNFTGLLQLINKPFDIFLTEMMDDPMTRSYMESRSTVAFCIFTVKDLKSTNPNGFLLLEWCSQSKAKNINTKIVYEEINSTLSKIQGLLL
jgi:hypothetical protein